MPLGLVSSEVTDDFWGQNFRRRILYNYPNGTAPLMALTSLVDTDSTPYPEFKWTEKRWQMLKTITASGATSNVPFYLGGTTTTAGSPATLTANQNIRVYVASSADFQPDDAILLDGIYMTGGATTQLHGVVYAKSASGVSPAYLEFKLTQAPSATIINSGGGATAAYNIGSYVVYSGSAFAEGARSRAGRYKVPYDVYNNTQIHKNAFEMTRTALKEPAKWDKTGMYKDFCKENGILHMAGLEYTAFFGQRGISTSANEDTGDTVPTRKSGGLLNFLRIYEAGGASASDYGGGQLADISASDWRTEQRKRIIDLAGNTISGPDWDDLMSRAFDLYFTTDCSKLVLGGNGFLNKFESYYKGQVTIQSLRDTEYEGFDFRFSQVQSNAGTIYFKTAPLFNDPSLPWMRNSGFILDLGTINWRPLTDSDTSIMKMIQPRDADRRKDQWITEGGMEFNYPDANMFIKNLGGITK